MTPFISNSGYLRIGLLGDKKSKRKNYSIHVIVASIFCTKTSDNKIQVNHLDGDKFHNFYKNLEWVTVSENNKHAYDTNLMKKGKEHHLGKVDDVIVHKIAQHFVNHDEMFDIIADIVGDPNIERSSDEYQRWRVYIKKLRQKGFRKDIINQYDF